jgi:hypothetical protein
MVNRLYYSTYGKTKGARYVGRLSLSYLILLTSVSSGDSICVDRCEWESIPVKARIIFVILSDGMTEM